MSGYTYGRYHVKQSVIDAVEDWVETGYSHGHFLMAVLENDLVDAVTHADGQNQPNLPGLVMYLLNNVPASCWGSKDKVRNWSERKAEERKRDDG